MTFGISRFNPTDYTGPTSNLIPIKEFKREPLTTDKKYPIGQFAILGKNPSTGAQGDIWYLSHFDGSGDAIWMQLAVGAGSPGIDTVTSNSGGAVSPDGVGNLDLLGDNTSGINIVGTPASNLQTVSGIQASESQRGTVELATSAETTTGTSTALAVHPAGLNTKLGAQTSNGLIYGQGGAGSNLGALAEATNGQLPIGSTGNPPTLGTLTAGNGMTITNGAGSITLDADVAGPGSSTDNALVRWNGPGGDTIQNSVTTQDDNGNFLIENASSGTNGTFIFRNLNDVANTGMNLQIRVGGSSAGDPFMRYAIQGIDEWSTGVKNSDSDSFYITKSNNLSSNIFFKIFPNGEITKPLQPAFLARLGSQVTNVTGAGTAFSLGSGTALTTIFDQNSDFNTNGTFTAPVTGRYDFTTNLRMGNITAAMTLAALKIITSNRTYQRDGGSPGATKNSANTQDFNMTIFSDMDAMDTATVEITLSNGAGDTASAEGFALIVTYFCGKLVC